MKQKTAVAGSKAPALIRTQRLIVSVRSLYMILDKFVGTFKIKYFCGVTD